MDYENSPFSVEQSHVKSDSDRLLKELTKYVNETHYEINITIFVQGVVISGMLITEIEYIDTVSGQYIGLSEEVLDIFWSSRDDSIKDDYIHLKNAIFHSAVSPITINNKVYWRGRLSSIDGFVVGELVIRG